MYNHDTYLESLVEEKTITFVPYKANRHLLPEEIISDKSNPVEHLKSLKQKEKPTGKVERRIEQFENSYENIRMKKINILH
ncbi:hypothetical protein [Legionella sp.]|uniref:hypothetical protein n=1 Tax=Legionella sp. TaxID=459 RepID=UPI003C8D9903